MKLVVLVGAGATLAEALPSRPARAERPPLDTTFFQLCQAAKLDGRVTLRQYMTSNYGIDPFGGNFGMEEVFNLLYSDSQSEPPPPKCLDAYWALIQMYRESIRLTTNPLRGKSRYGVGALLRLLVSRHPEPELTVITFNHDLVIEKALEEMVSHRRYEGLPWDLEQAYGLPFSDTVTVGGGTRRFRVLPGKKKSANAIRVLKLHGSMNWVYRVRSADDAKNALRQPRGQLLCINDQTVYRALNMKGRRRPYGLLPLVVPPVYEKSNHIRGVLGPVWLAARKAIEEAERFVVFGYSFPTADIAARSLIRRAYFANHPLSDVSVVDVNPQVAAVIAGHLEAPSVGFATKVTDLARVLPGT